MTNLDLHDFANTTDSSESSTQKSVKTERVKYPLLINTAGNIIVESVPVDIPDAVPQSAYQHLVRISGVRQAAKRIIINLNTKRLLEQARVRKTNEVIRRSRQS